MVGKFCSRQAASISFTQSAAEIAEGVVVVMITKCTIFTCESSYCFQRVLAIAILSIHLSARPSVCHMGGSGKNGPS